MPFSVWYNAELNAVETVFRDVITIDDTQAEMIERHRLATDYQTSWFIADTTNATIQISLTDIYNLLEEYENMGGERPVRVALINTNPQNQEFIDFYKLVGQNRGWNIETFSNPEQAIVWLRS